MKDLILKYALKNAISYGGNPNPKAVLGSVLSEDPNLKKDIGLLMKNINEICSNLSGMTLVEQEAKLMDIAPELLNEEKVIVTPSLNDLPNAQKGKVVMRFEPSPSGALHLGHALTFSLNAEYCKKYDGKLILRIADTNPSEIYPPAYDLIVEQAKWLTDYSFEVKLQSENMENYYFHAEKLIEMGKAYVCTCESIDFKNFLDKSKPCPCRDLDYNEQEKRWEKMHDKEGYNAGEAVLRIKTDLDAKNPALKEWPAFRISKEDHPKKGDKYKVWPLMNFSVAIDDHFHGLTHIIRGKDHVVNTERQLFLYDYFNWEKPHYIHIGKINFLDIKLSTSETRKLIEEGKYSGWDDIKLPFLSSLKKRGINPKVFADYAIEIGTSKVDKTLKIEEFMHKIYDHNKNYVNSVSRYSFVYNPIKITIENSPKETFNLALHPEEDRGFRSLMVSGNFYISKKDYENLEEGKYYRLMHIFNFVKKNGKFVFHSKEVDPSLKAKIINWVPFEDDQIIPIKVFTHLGEIYPGFAEKGVNELKIDSVIQFERFGFCSKQENNEFWFAHN